MTEIERMLLELLSMDSTTGNEQQIADHVVCKLKGFDIKKQFVDKKRYNIIAKKGKSDLWLVAHLDTVPGSIPIRVTSKRIYGRGACDNKANIAGAILIGNKLENINLLFTVGEEHDFVGAEKAKIFGKRVIVLEPTSLKAMNGQLGLVAYSVAFFGIEKHTSQKFDFHDNAIHAMIEAVAFLTKNKFNAFNVGIVQGGSADNVVASKAVVDISLRPRNDIEFSKAKNAFAVLEKKFCCKVFLKHAFRPYKSTLKIDGEVAPFASEMPFFKNSILFGTGNIQQAHTQNEYIERKQLNAFESNMEEFLLKL